MAWARARRGRTMTRPWWAVVAVLLVWTGLAVEAHAWATPERPRLNDELVERLRNGERVVHTRRAEINRGEVMAIVNVPIEGVYQILRAYNDYIHWYPDQVHARLLEETDTSGVAEGTVRVPFPFANRHYIVDVRGQQSEYEGRTVVTLQWLYREGSGNMEQLYGYWYLERWQDDPENKTLLRYQLNVDLGVWLPPPVVRWATRRMLPGIIDGLERRYQVINR